MIQQSTRKNLATDLVVFCLASVCVASIGGCRGEISDKPPVHLVPNMDNQEKLKAQAESDFPGWDDKRGMRAPVYGTVARGSLGAHDPDENVAKFHIYKNEDGTYVKTNPLPKTLANLERGRERFNINCAVCHGTNARGLGMVGKRLNPKPPNLVKKASDDDPMTRQEQVRTDPHTDGQLFEIITNGYSTMMPYKFQVTPKDRWAIVHYIRALQLRANSAN